MQRTDVHFIQLCGDRFFPHFSARCRVLAAIVILAPDMPRERVVVTMCLLGL